MEAKLANGKKEIVAMLKKPVASVHKRDVRPPQLHQVSLAAPGLQRMDSLFARKKQKPKARKTPTKTKEEP